MKTSLHNQFAKIIKKEDLCADFLFNNLWLELYYHKVAMTDKRYEEWFFEYDSKTNALTNWFEANGLYCPGFGLFPKSTRFLTWTWRENED